MKPSCQGEVCTFPQFFFSLFLQVGQGGGFRGRRNSLLLSYQQRPRFVTNCPHVKLSFLLSSVASVVPLFSLVIEKSQLSEIKKKTIILPCKFMVCTLIALVKQNMI